MNARISLLVIATGLFAAMWSSDDSRLIHPHRSARIEAGLHGMNSVAAQAIGNDSHRHDVAEAEAAASPLSESVSERNILSLGGTTEFRTDNFSTFGCIEVAWPTDASSHACCNAHENNPVVGQSENIGSRSDQIIEDLIAEMPIARRPSLDQIDETPHENHWIFAGFDWPLPPNIVPGEYRVVDSAGSVDTMTLTAADLGPSSIDRSDNARNLYVVDDYARRWYFIRVEVDQSPAVSADKPRMARSQQRTQL